MNKSESMNAFDLLLKSSKRKGEEESKDSPASKHKKYDDQKRKRSFNRKWEEGRSWLFYDEKEQKMFCTWCKENNVVDSNFVKGTENFKIEAIKQHETSKWHVYYAPRYQNKGEESEAVNCIKKLIQHDKEKLQNKFRTAHALAKHGKSFNDFKFICSLDKAKGIDIGDTYCNDISAKAFITAIAHIERQKVIDMIKTAKFFSFSCDGTTDFTGEDLECIYIRISSNGKIHDLFLHIGSPESASSEDIYNYIMDIFKKCGFDNSRLIGFTADGASNMQGLKSGLAARLLDISPHIVITHCVAHRLELAFKDAIKQSSKSKMYDKAMTLLLGLFYLYRKSPKMKKGLLRSFDSLNQRQILPVRVGGTRWLPHMSLALRKFFKGYRAIRLHLENASHSNAKAEGLAKLMRDGHLVIFLLVLKEVIHQLMQLSLFLQRENLILSDAYLEVEATQTVLDEMEKRPMNEAENAIKSKSFDEQPLTFTPQLCNPTTLLCQMTKSTSAALSSRFKENRIVNATSIASFTNWPIPKSASIPGYGNEEVLFLATNFKDALETSDVDVEQCTSEWVKLKTRVYKRYSTELSSKKLTWEMVYHGCMDMSVKNISSLIDLVLSLPATSVRNECLFSTMKLVKGKRRGRLTNKTLDDLLLIAVESPPIAEYNPDDAILHWMNTPGSRRLGYKRKSKEKPQSEQSAVQCDSVVEGSTSDEVTIESQAESTDVENMDDDVVANDDVDNLDDIDDEESDNEQSENENSNMINRFSHEIELEIEREFD